MKTTVGSTFKRIKNNVGFGGKIVYLQYQATHGKVKKKSAHVY